MKPLIILITSFVFSLILIRLVSGEYDFTLSGGIAMSVMLVFTAIGHFVYTQGMSMMIPEFIPYKKNLVFLTGFFEILLAIGILTPNLKIISGWVLILFLLLVLPANIYGCMNNINYQTGSINGNGVTYLWFRIPLQFLFIIWVYISTIRTI